MRGKRLGPPCAKCGQCRCAPPFVIPDNKKTNPWEKCIRGACLAALQKQAKISGPVKVSLIFSMPRPKSHYLKKGLRDNAPHYHESRPDVDKLSRTVLDGLTDLMFEDDCKVVSLEAIKPYTNGGTQDCPWGDCGVFIEIEARSQVRVAQPADVKQLGLAGIAP